MSTNLIALWPWQRVFSMTVYMFPREWNLFVYCLACVTFPGSWLLLFMFLSLPSNGYYCDSDWVKFLFNKLIVPIYCPVCTIPEEGKKFAWHSGVGVIEGRYFHFPREFNHQRYNFVVTVYFIILSIRGTCFMQKFITVIANLCHFRNSSPPEDT